MTIQHFKSLRELNRFLKTAPLEVSQSRINEVKTRGKKKKGAAFMVWVDAEGNVVDLSMEE